MCSISYSAAPRKGGRKKLAAALLADGVIALDGKRQYCVTKPKDALRSTLLNMATGD